MSGDTWIVIFTGVVAAATVALFVATQRLVSITEQTQREMKALQERSNWLMGAMESHSTTMMRLEAKNQGIPVIWWDPTDNETGEQHWPVYDVAKHGEEATLEKIYTGIPLKLRKSP